MRSLLAPGPMVTVTVCIALLALPYAGASGSTMTTVIHVMIAAVLGLSYNMLFGQSGMLSFGHAVFYGLGVFATLHLMNLVAATGLPIPLELMPVGGGVIGLVAAAIFGAVCTLRGGLGFAMITLAIGEMVVASSLVFPDFFGARSAVTADRVLDWSLTGWTYGPQWQVYLLVTAWVILTALLIYLQRDTPLGRAASANRDNEERVRFLGYNPRWIRYAQFVLAGTFAGVAGGLFALTFEVGTINLIGLAASADILLAVFIGGRAYFAGPIVGAIVLTIVRSGLADWTPAWHLYNGLLFILMVAFAPHGFVGLAVDAMRLLREGSIGSLLPAIGRKLAVVVPFAVGAVILIEFAYRRSTARDASADIPLLGQDVAPGSPWPWLVGLVLCAGAYALHRVLTRPTLMVEGNPA
jgi:branched-chain amino acid transport system permease protein